jgi:uncharacterized membrane protein
VTRVNKDRTLAFSDGVFAIAITLLVLNIEIPDVDTQTSAELESALDDTVPELISYFIGFFVIGLFWIRHHRFFDSLRGYDERLMLANLLFLALVALLPFPTAVLGEHAGLTVGVVIYASFVAAAGLADTLMLWLALDRNLAGPQEQANPRRSLLRSLITPVIFLASIPVAFVEPDVAPYLWLGLAFLPRLARPLRSRT